MNLHLKKLKILLKYNYIFFLTIIFISLIRANIPIKSSYNENNNYFKGTIIDYKYNETYITFTIKTPEKIKCNYYLKENEKININYGDKVILTGTLKEPNNNTIPNTFNYKKYLNNNNIKYILTIETIEKIEKSNNLFYKIKNKINERINNIDDTGYLNTFILGNKNYIDNETYNTYKDNGIIHIFSISGMHISILSSIILKILDKIKKSKYNILLVIIFLSFYLVLTNYQASIVRSIVFFSILQSFKLLNIKVNTKDCLLIAISIILIIYPKYIYNIGFLYSSIISYTLIYYSNYFNKNYIVNTLLISLVSFLISLPITINNNYSINIFSIFINLIFVPLVSFILYPLSLIVFICPLFYKLFYIFIEITEYLSYLFSLIKIFTLSIPKLSFISILIYYILIYLVLSKNKKIIVLLLIFIIFIKYKSNLDDSYYVHFLDIGQGDMSVMKQKDKTILIDTGPPSYNKNYNTMDNVIIFFKSIGINNIDNLIITHGDLDHIGNAQYLIENFKVEKVIFNCGPYNDLEQELIKVLDKKKIPYYSCIKELNIDNNKLNFLQTKEYDNENDNSNVIYTELGGYKFMFMGDAGVTTEKEILKKYNLLNIDVLKVGHHGSKTSSSKEFIDEINPKYTVISVGKNNRFGHPTKEVLDNL